jgi:hypothetical protein
MEAGGSALEYSQLQLVAEVEKAKERIGLSDGEVVPCQEADASSSGENIAEMLLKELNATRESKGDGEICFLCMRETREQMREQRIVFASMYASSAADQRIAVREGT